jgi:hypothetical protein
MSLRGRPILIVYGLVDLFVLELEAAFDVAGANTVIACTPADAMRHLQHLDFDAVVINHVQGLDAGNKELVEELAGNTHPGALRCSSAGITAALAMPGEARARGRGDRSACTAGTGLAPMVSTRETSPSGE